MHGSLCRAVVQACQPDKEEGRKKGGGEGTEQRKRGAGVFSRSPGLLEVQEEPLINYDHYNHHLCQGH